MGRNGHFGTILAFCICPYIDMIKVHFILVGHMVALCLAARDLGWASKYFLSSNHINL